MRLPSTEQMTSSYRDYFTASGLIPLLLLIEVSANFCVYVARSGLCTGANLALVSSTQTYDAGALPLAISYPYAPPANILVAGLDLDLAGMTRSIIWLFICLMFIRWVFTKRFVLAFLSVTTLILTLSLSKVERTHNCDLVFSHKNAETIFTRISKLNSEDFLKSVVRQTEQSKSVIELLGERGEPTCAVYILKTSFPARKEHEAHPSWYYAVDVLKRQDVQYATQLHSIVWKRKNVDSVLLSINPFKFTEGHQELQFYSLLACDPTMMPVL